MTFLWPQRLPTASEVTPGLRTELSDLINPCYHASLTSKWLHDLNGMRVRTANRHPLTCLASPQRKNRGKSCSHLCKYLAGRGKANFFGAEYGQSVDLDARKDEGSVPRTTHIRTMHANLREICAYFTLECHIRARILFG